MISQIFTQNCFKVLTLINLSPGSKFNRKQIKEKTKLNNIPLDRTLKILLSSKILIKEKNYYSLNFESRYTKSILEIISKQFNQLKQLPLDVYYILLDLIEFFSNKNQNEIFLFGSYSKLIYTINSDIDIAIISNKNNDKLELNKLLIKLKKIYNKDIQFHYFNKNDFNKNKKDPIIASILKDGIKLI